MPKGGAMHPPELEKPPAGTDGSTNHLDGKTLPTVYRCDSRPATFRTLRLIHGARFAAPVLQKAVDDVRQHAETLPLWAFRLYQHQRLGRLGYQQTWDALYEAGRESGSDKWVRCCLLHAIGQANASAVAPPSMQALLRGLI